MCVTLCMPMFPVWVFGVSFCGSYCPNVVFLACGGTWRCQYTLFCVEIVKRHLYIFIHSFIHLSQNDYVRILARMALVFFLSKQAFAYNMM